MFAKCRVRFILDIDDYIAAVAPNVFPERFESVTVFILFLKENTKTIKAKNILHKLQSKLDQIDKMDPDLLNDYNKLEFFIRVLNDDVEDLKEYVANTMIFEYDKLSDSEVISDISFYFEDHFNDIVSEVREGII